MEDFCFRQQKVSKLRVGTLSPLQEVTLGDDVNKRSVYVSSLLDVNIKNKLIKLLIEYKDYFAWDYHEMPGLDGRLVEHFLPIKARKKPDFKDLNEATTKDEFRMQVVEIILDVTTNDEVMSLMDRYSRYKLNLYN